MNQDQQNESIKDIIKVCGSLSDYILILATKVQKI